VLGKELLELLGMPVMRAKWEAEALCAELDREGWVDACVTPDSDAFLHGAKCIIKYLQLDPRDPLVETYTSMDIETMLGLQQKHMVALALLIGCDYDLKGVEGIGCSHAMRFVRSFPEAEILDRSGFLHVPNLWLARTRSLLMQQLMSSLFVLL
jgi:flap endonuclease GEN